MRLGSCTRVLLVGMFAVMFGGASCKDRSASEERADDNSTVKAAGIALEVTGAVTATRESNSESRALSKGDDVFADDVIETSEAASAVIELHHNAAQWQLGSRLKMRLDKSAAWRAPQRERSQLGDTKPTDEGAAAGRNSGKEAAEGAATAQRPESETAGRGKGKAAGEVGPTTGGVVGRPSSQAPGTSGTSGTRDATDEKSLKASPTASPRDAVADPATTKSNKTKLPPKPPKLERTPDTDGDGSERAFSSEEVDADQAERIRKVIRTCRAKFKSKAKGNVKVTQSVRDGQGRVSVRVPSGWKAVDTCIRKALKVVGEGDESATAEVTFE